MSAHFDYALPMNNCTDVFIIGLTRQCFAQLSKRRLITADDYVQLLTILSRAIDNAADANEALNRANAILRGDV